MTCLSPALTRLRGRGRRGDVGVAEGRYLAACPGELVAAVAERHVGRGAGDALKAVELALAKRPKVSGGGAGQIYLAPELARVFDTAQKIADKAGDNCLVIEAERPGPEGDQAPPSQGDRQRLPGPVIGLRQCFGEGLAVVAEPLRDGVDDIVG